MFLQQVSAFTKNHMALNYRKLKFECLQLCGSQILCTEIYRFRFWPVHWCFNNFVNQLFSKRQGELHPVICHAEKRRAKGVKLYF